MPDRPTPGQLEERSQPLEVDGRRIRGVIPFGVESRDLGGWREVIEPTALQGARLDDLTLTVEHGGIPLARHPNTLQIEQRGDGVHWSAEPPQSRQDYMRGRNVGRPHPTRACRYALRRALPALATPGAVGPTETGMEARCSSTGCWPRRP